MKFNSVSETTQAFFRICQSLVNSGESFSATIRHSSVIDWNYKTDFITWQRDPEHMNTGIEATLYPYNECFLIQLTAGNNDLHRNFRNNIFWRDLTSDADIAKKKLQQIPLQLNLLWEAASILATYHYEMKIQVIDEQKVIITGNGSYSLVWIPTKPDTVSIHRYKCSIYSLEEINVTTLEGIMEYLKWNSETHTCCWDEKI